MLFSRFGGAFRHLDGHGDMPSSSPSSSSSSGGTSAKRRLAKYERKFLRAAARGSLRGCKKALKRASSRGSGDAGFLDVTSASDHDGRTALHLACASGDDDLARWLIKRGADVTSTDARGDTPAHLAAHRAPDNVAIARRLTRAGASAHARNDAGETPSSIAERAAESRAARMREFDARREAKTRRARDADDYEGLGSGPSREAIEEMAWRDLLRAEAARGDAIDEFGGGGAGIGTRDEMDAFYASYRDDSDDGNAYAWREEEEAYAEYVRAGMAARRRRRRNGDDCDDDDDDARRRRRYSAAEAQARATRERDEAAQRVLDEERRKDAEWRERTTRRADDSKGGRPEERTTRRAKKNVLQTDFAAHRRRWGVAAAMADRGESIAYADVPWPFDPESAVAPDERVVRDVLLGPEGARMAPSEARRALRSEMLRWHPDKFFASTVGSRVAVDDVERTRRGVNAVAGVIASLFKRPAGS